MSRSSTRPSSPVPHDGHPHIAQDGGLISDLPRVASSSQLADLPMGRPKERPRLEIVLDAQHLALKGTGVDVEPAWLSGHVVLCLPEDTAIKEITLQFRGKAHIPTPASESLATPNGSSSTSFTFCNHDWSFLEGNRKHAHTLKAGRHTFPFRVQIGSSLPSTITTPVFGGASVAYTLRALAIRPGFSHNLQATAPVYVIRALGHEALEYQQTLEIEDTWPDKLMYSVVVPHKAWAAGDNLTAVLKFFPIIKGVRVSGITTSIIEITKIHTRSGTREKTRIVTSHQHDITSGGGAPADPRHPQHHVPSDSSQSHTAGDSTDVASTSGSETHRSTSSSPRAHSPNEPPISSRFTVPTQSPSLPFAQGDSVVEESNDIETVLSIPIPSYTITPSHSVEPIVVSHRVRWSMLIHNPDGHTSELRCTLPIHVLDHRLLDEARALSCTTRRLVLGCSEASFEDEDGGRELPSYDAHVRDRVANMFLPEAAIVRVNNPWINRVTSRSESDLQPVTSQPESSTQARHPSPLEAPSLSHLPHTPGPHENPTLSLLNSEILLSLSLSDRPRRDGFFNLDSRTPSEPPEHESSQPQSQDRSQLQSQNNSRPQSPRRSRSSSPDGAQHHGDTAAHHGRNLQNIIRATMKPFTALTHHHGLFSRHNRRYSDHNSHSHHVQQHAGVQTEPTTRYPSRPGSAAPVPDQQVIGLELIQRLFTEVPDYSIASRGFIGGVPPLESTRGLPSYEEAARVNAQRMAVGLGGGVANSNIQEGLGPGEQPRLEMRGQMGNVPTSLSLGAVSAHS